MQNSPAALPSNAARPWLKSFGMAIIAVFTTALMANEAAAKTPGSTYCFYKTCHRVKTLAETRAMVGREHTLPASFYDDCKADRYNPCGLTSSGETFRPNEPDNAASPIYPDGTKLLVWSADTKQAIVLRINNAGPYWGNRTLDVSRAAAEKLGFKKRGVANLRARVLEAPSRAEATYKKGRHYAPVAGDIGQYASAHEAHAAINSMQMVASATLAPFNGSTLPANLTTDVMPPPALAVAALTERPKLSDDAIADAKSLVAFAWPVVRAADVNQAEVADLDVAPQAKRSETWSQRVTKAKLRGEEIATISRRTASNDIVRRAPAARKKAVASVERKPLQKAVAVRVTVVSKPKMAAIKTGASKTGFKPVPASATPALTSKIKQAAVVPAKIAPVSGAAYDKQIALRPYSIAAKPKLKQAAIKPVLKTSALMITKPKPRV